MENRLELFAKKLKERDLDALFLTDESNVRYLSGFTGSETYLFISQARSCLITDHRYTEQAERECGEFTVVPHTAVPGHTLYELIAAFCAEDGVRELGFEKEHLMYDEYEKLSGEVAGTELVPTAGIVEEMRLVKSAGEAALLKEACAATDRVFAKICGFLRPGLSEKQVEREMLYYILGEGCESSFSIIVASGVNGSLPHAIPGTRSLQPGELVTMDFGCMYQGYHADMTRTVCLGKADEKTREIYGMVLEAKNRAQSLVRPGAVCRDIDAAARDYFAEKGYAEYFKHGLGHGVGLDIHEAPRLNTSSNCVLEQGYAVTVEPGLYLPGWGGVRIEDTVLVTEDGCDCLFTSPTELICL
ncbi:MAG: aminopeptidase P family protein [Firmicutes bacterium]|nr:aminopeptidase P family protein [Bacillota bacterium]